MWLKVPSHSRLSNLARDMLRMPTISHRELLRAMNFLGWRSTLDDRNKYQLRTNDGKMFSKYAAGFNVTLAFLQDELYTFSTPIMVIARASNIGNSKWQHSHSFQVIVTLDLRNI